MAFNYVVCTCIVHAYVCTYVFSCLLMLNFKDIDLAFVLAKVNNNNNNDNNKNQIK